MTHPNYAERLTALFTPTPQSVDDKSPPQQAVADAPGSRHATQFPLIQRLYSL